MISQDRLEKAMNYLATTDLKAAEWTAEAERMEFKARATKDAIFLHNPENLKTVAEREAYAGSNSEYMMAMDAYFEALQESLAVKNKRQTEALVIDVWRSMNANRRQAA